MDTTSFMTFKVSDSTYAVETASVVEIVPMPEISRLDETPTFVVGVANVRGRLIPVLDLNLRFGHSWQQYRVEQCILLLELDRKLVGIIADSAEAVLELSAEQIVPTPLYDFGSDSIKSRFVQGVAKSNHRIVMILNLADLIGLEQTYGGELADVRVSESVLVADASPEFVERSRRLAEPADEESSTGRLPFAVVRIGEEFFGIELATVIEFAELHHLTPIPCCPEHVAGQINLRGELITVLEVSKFLNLAQSPNRSHQKVVVIDRPQQPCGVLVDELKDVSHLHIEDITPHPRTDREYLRGVAHHGTTIVTLIDLLSLLSHGDLTVNETP